MTKAEKFLLYPAAGDIDEDNGMTELEIMRSIAAEYGYMVETVEARMVAENHRTRLQNAVNWAARSAYVHAGAANAHFIGHIMPELNALDDGAKLEEPEVK